MQISGLSGAEALLRLLRQMGIERIFASPGSEWAPVWEYLAKPYGAEDEIPVYLSARHEEVSVAMAAGYTRACGKLAAVMIHTTVGSLHATMALREALHQRVPMVVLAGGSSSFGEQRGHDPGHQWLRLLADVGGPARLVERCVKWSLEVPTAATLAATLQRACQLATATPHGPVFVSIPMELLFETLAADAPAAASFAQPAVASSEALARLARMLTEARNPVIITEEAGRSPRAVEHLVALAEALGAPVVEGWVPGYVNFPRTHPLYGGIGPLAHLGSYMKEADLVFLAAAVAPWHPPSAAPGPGTKLVVLDDDPFHPLLPYWGFRADLVVTGEIEGSLAALTGLVRAALPAGSRAASAERWRAQHTKARQALREQAQASGGRPTIETRWIAHELNQVLPADAIVVDETITHRLELHRNIDSLTPGRFFEASNGGLGTGLGTALGAKAAHPDRPVVLLIGDGAFNYNPGLAAFGFCQEHRMPILIVLFNNSGYLSQKSGIPHHYPDGFAVRSRTFVGTSIAPSPDYTAVAQAFGGYGEKVTKPGEVRAALQRGLQRVVAGQFALLDMTLEPINPSGEV
jgi:acetolactate synthase-1/2/3 large subunit